MWHCKGRCYWCCRTRWEVVAELVSDIAAETIADFSKRGVNTEDAKLYTDQFKGDNSIGKGMEHETINRSEQWETDGIRTNTMEGFWFFVKRAWYGSLIIIQQVTRHYISQRRATRTTTEERTSLPSFSQRVWCPGKLKISQVQNDLFRFLKTL